jgi:rare lipoprotein A
MSTGERLGLWLLLTTLAACSSAPRATAPPPGDGRPERGLASWYGEPYHGRRTASGEIYDMNRMTAAHRTLPFGAVVRVRREDTGVSVQVRITDRGPFVSGRIIDLSRAAAEKLDMLEAGVVAVEVTVVGREPVRAQPATTAAAATAAECWWVQVGAFSNAANASRARQRLLDDGFPTVAMEGPSGVTRVRVGPFDARSDADRAQRDLQSSGWPAAQVVECGG